MCTSHQFRLRPILFQYENRRPCQGLKEVPRVAAVWGCYIVDQNGRNSSQTDHPSLPTYRSQLLERTQGQKVPKHTATALAHTTPVPHIVYTNRAGKRADEHHPHCIDVAVAIMASVPKNKNCKVAVAPTQAWGLKHTHHIPSVIH
jgi:hypothetical protein